MYRTHRHMQARKVDIQYFLVYAHYFSLFLFLIKTNSIYFPSFHCDGPDVREVCGQLVMRQLQCPDCPELCAVQILSLHSMNTVEATANIMQLSLTRTFAIPRTGSLEQC